MPKNQEFAALLTNLNTNTALAANPRYKEALDAILKSNYAADANAFRTAIFNYRDVWIALSGNAFDANDFNPPNAQTDNSLFNSNNNTLGQRFVDLYQLAAKKRIELALSEANEALLQGIIYPGSPQSVRQQLAIPANETLFGKVVDWKGNGDWDANNDRHLPRTSTDEIILAAKKALLIQKIKAVNTDQARQYVENLLLASNQNHQVNFQRAAQDLGIADANVRGTLTPDLITGGSELEKAALRKAFELRVKHQFGTDFNNLGAVYAALDVATPQFNPHGQAVANGIYHQKFQTDAEANWAKSILGERYLKGMLTVHANSNELLQVANATTDTATLRGVIQPLFDGNNRYVAHAVNDANAKDLRQIAAIQALKLKIAACSDPAALKALADTRDMATLRSVLEKYPALGFSGAANSSAREILATSDARLLTSLLGAAYVRSSINSATPEQLIAAVPNANFTTNYKQHFGLTSAPQVVKQAVDVYFSDEANIIKTRQEALAGLLKAKVATLSIAELNAISQAANQGQLQAALQINGLMGVGNTAADNLIPIADPPYPLLQGYARAEELVRAHAAVNLSAQATHANFVALITNFIQNGVDGTQVLLQALPPQDQAHFRKQLVELLIKNYPLAYTTHAPIADLNALMQATDAHDVQAKIDVMLGGAAIDLSWIDESISADLQRQASARLISRQVAAYSAFPAEAHPHLLAFITHLSLDKQKAILAKPEVVGSLMKAQSIEEIRRLVGATNSSASALVAENERLNKLNKIANSAIAATLASVVPPITLSNQQINAINTQLLGHVDPKDLFRKANYQTFLTNLRDDILQVQPANRAAFNRAFGMNAQGTAIDNQTIRQAIKEQQGFNAPLIDMVVNNNPKVPTPDEIKAIELLMAISKSQNYAQGDLAAFVNAINTSATYDALLTVITTTVAINQHLVAGWKKHITPEMFASYKQDQKQRAWSNQGTYAAGIMATEQGEINTLKQRLQKITSIDKYYREELEHLGKLTQTQWISPEFEVAARQQYNTLYPKLKEFARDCDTILEELRRQKAIYEDKLNALPDTSAMPQRQQKKDIDNFRKQLKASLENINNGISYYEKASLTLNGNPSAEDALARKGLIQHLEDCKQGTNVVFTTSGITYNDFPASEKNQHFAKGYVPGAGKQAGTTNTSIATQPNKTYIVDKLQPGMCREYVMTGTKQVTDNRGQPATAADVGTFIEEAHAGHLDPKTVNKKTEVNPNATITVAQFPKDDKNQIKYTMAMAAQLLAHLDHAPTKERPIVLTGSNPVELRHLWTALMVLGENNPKMKFDHNAIKVNSTAFDPANELGKVYGFNKTALYNTYMKQPTIQQMIATIKTFTESKEAEKGSTKEVTKKIANLLQQFKTEGAKQTLDEIETANKRGRAPGLNG
ncbi:interaptin [Legionella erythra]|uniref:Interaptin n=1 Tax=Legionella erythra TaxID=448 RepID=A0A0W0TJQ7_LEGER|nr:interaptin [Legionella erythra]